MFEFFTCSPGANREIRTAPCRIGLAPVPTPTTPALAEHYYPHAHDIAPAAAEMLGAADRLPKEAPTGRLWNDVPDPSFAGPY